MLRRQPSKIQTCSSYQRDMNLTINFLYIVSMWVQICSRHFMYSCSIIRWSRYIETLLLSEVSKVKENEFAKQWTLGNRSFMRHVSLSCRKIAIQTETDHIKRVSCSLMCLEVRQRSRGEVEFDKTERTSYAHTRPPLNRGQRRNTQAHNRRFAVCILITET